MSYQSSPKTSGAFTRLHEILPTLRALEGVESLTVTNDRRVIASVITAPGHNPKHVLRELRGRMAGRNLEADDARQTEFGLSFVVRDCTPTPAPFGGRISF